MKNFTLILLNTVLIFFHNSIDEVYVVLLIFSTSALYLSLYFGVFTEKERNFGFSAAVMNNILLLAVLKLSWNTVYEEYIPILAIPLVYTVYLVTFSKI